MRWTSKVSFWFREIDVVSIVRGRGQGNYIGAVKRWRSGSVCHSVLLIVLCIITQYYRDIMFIRVKLIN